MKTLRREDQDVVLQIEKHFPETLLSGVWAHGCCGDYKLHTFKKLTAMELVQKIVEHGIISTGSLPIRINNRHFFISCDEYCDDDYDGVFLNTISANNAAIPERYVTQTEE